ncbi:hypothetical protein BJX64DRAFT_14388 [Aspergillus heterothallicus]
MGKHPTQQLPDMTLSEQVSDKIFKSGVEARSAAKPLPQAVLHQEMKTHTQQAWNNTIMSHIHMKFYSPGDRVAIPVLESHKTHGQRGLSHPSQLPFYDPLDDSALASAPHSPSMILSTIQH